MATHDPSSGHRILVVDDEPAIRDVMQMLLELEGYVVRTAADGRQALELLACDHCDLVITDLMMPVMDGDELARRIRADAGIAQLPILLTTASVLPDGPPDGLFNGCLDKPYDLAELLARIEWLLRRRAA